MAPGSADCVEHAAARREPSVPTGCASRAYGGEDARRIDQPLATLRAARTGETAHDARPPRGNCCYTPPVPLLNAADRLSFRPNRVLVAGTSGSGKSTLAARLAELFGTEHVEIDGLFHGPGWVPREEFVADVERFSSQPVWVTEWQYHTVRPLLAERADLLVWLDYRRHVVMRRVVARTLRRRVRNEELCNGNREQSLWRVFVDRDHIVRWAWRTHAATPRRVAELLEQRPELVVVRLRSPKECEAWVAGLVRQSD